VFSGLLGKGIERRCAGQDDRLLDLVASVPAFVVAVVLISASPGPAMALIMRRAALRGFVAAVPTVLGLEAGLYLWALFAAAGLAAMVAASQVAFVILRVVGAGFLIYLGVKAWRTAWRGRTGSAQAPTGDLLPNPKTGWWKAFGEGALVMLANPKAAVFMIAFYPQFVPADRPLFATTALLALLQVAVEIVLYLGLAAVVGRASAWFRRPVIRRRLEAVSGTVLIALGLRVAAASR
jgi:threonine/homoserine/homoserine lactone efflux protein